MSGWWEERYSNSIEVCSMNELSRSVCTVREVTRCFSGNGDYTHESLMAY